MTLLASCAREPSDVTTFHPPVINQPGNEVMAELVGTITTGDNQVVADALVSIQGYSTMTDGNGKFSFENAVLFKDGTYIQVEKPGYLFGSRKIYALEAETNVAQIELIPEPEVIMVSGIQEIVDESALLSIKFPTGDYLLSANEKYSGDINAHLTTITGNSKNYNKTPGDLSGVVLNSDLLYEVKALSNFGIFNVGLSSQSREQLQLPENSKAQFELKLADADLNTLPSVVSVFHFDQLNGTWVDKGEASLIGDQYVGDIDGTGYWMLGESFPYTDVEGSLQTPDGTYNDTYVEIFNQDKAYVNTLNTTKSGRYAGRIPQEIDLALGVFHECAAGNQTKELGIITQEEELINLIIVQTEMENIAILGNVKDCDGMTQDRAYVKISFKDLQFLYRTDELGNFDYSFANCSDTKVSIAAISDVDKTVSEVLDLDISSTINTGDIPTCDDVVAGYDISYTNMEWQEELSNTTDHSWSISRITGTNPRTIFSVKMVDKDLGNTYVQGSFVIKENESLVDYQLAFEIQGFTILGQCEVELVNHNGFVSYRFFGIGDDIAITDNALYPSNGVDAVDFSLVYYD